MTANAFDHHLDRDDLPETVSSAIQVQAVDAAGNVGEPSAVTAFTIDDSLPVPENYLEDVYFYSQVSTPTHQE
jgi:hypothetical protein